MAASENMNLRLKPEERARWEGAAAAEGRTLTGLVKWAVETYLTQRRYQAREGLAAVDAGGQQRVATPGEMQLAQRATEPADPWAGVAAGDMITGTPQDFGIDIGPPAPPWRGRVKEISDGEMVIETVDDGDDVLPGTE